LFCWVFRPLPCGVFGEQSCRGSHAWEPFLHTFWSRIWSHGTNGVSVVPSATATAAGGSYVGSLAAAPKVSSRDRSVYVPWVNRGSVCRASACTTRPGVPDR